MEKVSLRDVDIKNVSLKELVEFMEAMKEEFPVAVKILTKRLLTNDTGPVQMTDAIPHYNDDERIIGSMMLLKDDIAAKEQGKASAKFVLGLHEHFGFGKIRMMRIMEQAPIGPNRTVNELIEWCEKRGIDYDATFGYNPSSKDNVHKLDVIRYGLAQAMDYPSTSPVIAKLKEDFEKAVIDFEVSEAAASRE